VLLRRSVCGRHFHRKKSHAIVDTACNATVKFSVRLNERRTGSEGVAFATERQRGHAAKVRFAGLMHGGHLLQRNVPHQQPTVRACRRNVPTVGGEFHASYSALNEDTTSALIDDSNLVASELSHASAGLHIPQTHVTVFATAHNVVAIRVEVQTLKQTIRVDVKLFRQEFHCFTLTSEKLSAKRRIGCILSVDQSIAVRSAPAVAK
jgi:hypothetical protein